MAYVQTRIYSRKWGALNSQVKKIICRLVDLDERMKIKEIEKIDKHSNLAIKIKKLKNMKLILIIVDMLRMAPSDLEKRQGINGD